MEGSLPNTIRVRLVKRPGTGLGFLATKQEKAPRGKPCVTVHKLLPEGVAEESGLVQPGDYLVRINDIDVSDMPYNSVITILKAIPDGTAVVLLLRGPDGFSTHLETIFLEDGTPKTVRVTAPVGSNLTPYRVIKQKTPKREESKMNGHDVTENNNSPKITVTDETNENSNYNCNTVKKGAVEISQSGEELTVTVKHNNNKLHQEKIQENTGNHKGRI